MGINVSLRLYFQRLVRSKNDTPHNLGVNDDLNLIGQNRFVGT